MIETVYGQELLKDLENSYSARMLTEKMLMRAIQMNVMTKTASLSALTTKMVTNILLRKMTKKTVKMMNRRSTRMQKEVRKTKKRKR